MDIGVWQATAPWGYKESDMTEHACIVFFTSDSLGFLFFFFFKLSLCFCLPELVFL